MVIKINDKNIVLNDIRDFELEHIFDCGQCFRFYKTNTDEYTGVAMKHALRISKFENSIILHNTTEKEFNEIWRKYFDLERDYSKIKSALSGEECMDNAINEGYGIRILNQDIFEAIISFIISQSNNIPRIKGIIEKLCSLCGDRITYENREYYTFPEPDKILECDISQIRAGYRDKYIINAAKTVHDNPEILTQLKNSDSKTAKEILMSFEGIGEKVSNCILLFGLGKTDSFPVDVWMKRIMEQMYFKKTCTTKEISDYASKKFGEYSGIAQQYLFFYALNHKQELN